jgi:hypothetical protein
MDSLVVVLQVFILFLYIVDVFGSSIMHWTSVSLEQPRVDASFMKLAQTVQTGHLVSCWNG